MHTHRAIHTSRTLFVQSRISSTEHSAVQCISHIFRLPECATCSIVGAVNIFMNLTFHHHSIHPNHLPHTGTHHTPVARTSVTIFRWQTIECYFCVIQLLFVVTLTVLLCDDATWMLTFFWICAFVQMCCDLMCDRNYLLYAPYILCSFRDNFCRTVH